MPIIQVQMLEGRSKEQKSSFMKELNEVVCRSLDVKPEQVKILIHELPKENWSTGGISKADELN